MLRLAALTLAGVLFFPGGSGVESMLTVAPDLATLTPDVDLSPDTALGSQTTEPTVPPASEPDTEPDSPTTEPIDPPTSEPEPAPPVTTARDDDAVGDGNDTIDDENDATVRISASPQVRSTDIPLGSIVLAVIVLAGAGLIPYLLARRRPGLRTPRGVPRDEPIGRAEARPFDDSTDGAVRRRTSTDTLAFLLGLGESLIDAGDAVSHVESTLRTVARVNGVDDLGVLVLPTALIVSVPGGSNVATQVSAAGRAELRLDQIDDVLRLVQQAKCGDVDVVQGQRRLAHIRSSAPPFPPKLALMGSVCSTVGLAAILRAGWREIVIAIVLGMVIGSFRLSTRRLGSSYQPFIPLIAATVVSISVFAVARVLDDLLTFPLLIAPLVTFLPGALLTMAVLELSTGQIISGASRLASGVMKLVLLALGIVAGRQLVGVPAGDLRAGVEGPLAVIFPWVGVAVFGIGVVWFHGARASARFWIVLVLYVAYSGQVIGGLFFGGALSAFFGALAMTPVATLGARQPSGPTPLVTFLPGFWILVPGALGLEGVTQLLGDGAVAGSGALVTTITSMVGISLGVLLGNTLAGSDPDQSWMESGREEHASRFSSTPRSGDSGRR